MGNQPLRRKRRSGVHRKKSKIMTAPKNHESQKSELGSQKKHQEPHPDHNPDKGVIVNPPSGEALKHDQEVEEAAKRTAVPAEKSEVRDQKSEKDAEK